jgi:hypothetical protein
LEARSSTGISDFATTSAKAVLMIERSGEGGIDDRAQQLVDLLGLELGVGPHQLLQQRLGIERFQGVGPEGAHADRPEVRVAHHHGVRRAPLEVGDLAGADEVELGHEGAVEAILPAGQGAEDGEVLRLQAVLAGAEDVGHLALPHEDGALAGPHDELGPVLDLVVVAREAPHQCMAAVVDPFDDVDEFRAQLVDDSHGLPLPQVRSRTSVSSSDPTVLPSSGSRLWPIV